MNFDVSVGIFVASKILNKAKIYPRVIFNPKPQPKQKNQQIPVIAVFSSVSIAMLITILTGFFRFSVWKFFLFFCLLSSTIVGVAALLGYLGSTLFSSTIGQHFAPITDQFIT